MLIAKSSYWSKNFEICSCVFLGINLKELNNYEELSLRHKLWFPNPYLCNLMPWSAILLLDNKNLSIKYQRFTPSLGWKDKSKRKSDFVAKTHFLCILFYFSVHWFIFSVFESVLCLSCPAFVLSYDCLVFVFLSFVFLS